MKKNVLTRGLLGFPLGIALGYAITIITSLIWGNGYYSPCVPQFVVIIGSEIRAVIVQSILCGIMGSGYAAASVIWEMDHLSIVAQTGICFTIYAVIMLPIAYFTNWMPHSILGFILYFTIFLVIFIILWIIQYIIWKNKVQEMNLKL